jgi:hypothetical protein
MKDLFETRSVMECGGPLPLFERGVSFQSASGLAQFKTWRRCAAWFEIVNRES